MIYQLREEWAIDPIVKMIGEKKDLFKITLEKAKNFLIKGISDELSIVLIDEKHKNLNGFLFASIEEFDGEDVCFIQTCIIVPDMEYTGYDFIARLKKWSKEKDINTIIMSTNSHKNGFERKYGFKFHSTLMTLAVNE